MFKSKNGYIEIKLNVEEIPMNNKMFKPKNGYADINLNEEDIALNNTMLKPKNDYTGINIEQDDKPNKLVTFCTSYNRKFFVHPLDPDYEHRYTDEREQIIKKKNINDISFDFECPKLRITRNTSKQKKVSYLNLHLIIYFLNCM